MGIRLRVGIITEQTIILDDAVHIGRYHLFPTGISMLDHGQHITGENIQNFRIEIFNILQAAVEHQIIIQGFDARMDLRIGCGLHLPVSWVRHGYT